MARCTSERFFEELALGDVPGRGEHQATFAVVHGAYSDLHWEGAAILAPVYVLVEGDLRLRSGSQGAAPGRLVAPRSLFLGECVRGEVLDREREQLPAAVAEREAGLGVAVHDPASRVVQEDGLHAVIEERPKAPLALDHETLGLPVLRDVRRVGPEAAGLGHELNVQVVAGFAQLDLAGARVRPPQLGRDPPAAGDQGLLSSALWQIREQIQGRRVGVDEAPVV